MRPLTRQNLTPILVAISLLCTPFARAEMGAASYKADGGDKAGKDKKKSATKKGERTPAPSDAGSGASVQCIVEKAPSGLTGVTEASGVAASRRTPGILWSHGDSHVGEPYLHAFDARGASKGKVRLEGVKVTDWEAISVGPCGSSSCVFIGDIGDNQAARKSITVHRLPEPLPTDQSAAPRDTFHATFPDGAHDAEAMFVSAAGEIFIVTKGETGPVGIYRFGSSPKSGGTTVLQKVATLQSGQVARDQWVTGGGASPDGRWVALRTHGAAYFYDAERLMRGDVKSPLKFDATALKEPQGEGLALGADGSVFFVGEGGRKGAPGTLSAGVCKLPGTGAPTP
jgi:hypothetical protein